MAQKNGGSSTSSASSKERLHYLTLPNDGLIWGSQRSVRCMSINRNCPISDLQSSAAQETDWRNEVIKKGQSGVSPLRNSDNRTNKSVPENENKGKEKVEGDATNNKYSPIKPWNLRKRAAPEMNGGATMERVKAKMATTDSGGGERGFNPNVSLQVRRLGSGLEQKKKRPRFSFSLTKEEIEEDFIAMTGAKPPRKPRKRPRVVQRKLNDLVPGFWLTEVTPESYDVDDDPEPRKGRLKRK